MSLPAFLHPNLAGVAAGDVISLTGPEGRHAVTVKRTAPGEQVLLIHSPGENAEAYSREHEGLYVEATVQETAGKDELIVRVDTVGQTPAPNPRVTVVQAIPKSERSELAIDLATQAGADEFIAWQSDRCIAKWDAKKAPKALQKWQAQAESAAKQSRRTRIPHVSGPLTTPQLVHYLQQSEKFDSTPLIYVLHEDAMDSIKSVKLVHDEPTSQADVVLLIGPEGGIGADELDALKAAGAHPVKLGPEVLRTASAGMVALAAIGVRTNRW
ncbi:16S rRNA (uracil(1498)-N(3))-methyltransferase [Corynebacterium casei]|uniref:16S rRNA (uracil(1498)-N(3))-methyltransferase n=1 Tax=Corynebacterium casei TaxID=160386 RepID=UPI0026484F49|nr:16S rRNA (uracil(1498)-N(3))-methyltransferase [Corynebacterium casei]MDN5840333.1 16S rRNA (uracil(1498)-N(3))-methyltransferase [Corynebacterium casei]MDN6263173.1 16S rRNA (uracil(1498)-N(3))-methyltransferase [Corynebacterium casei]